MPNPDSHAYQQNVTFTYDTILNATYVAAKYIQISKQIHMPPTFLEPSSEFEIWGSCLLMVLINQNDAKLRKRKKAEGVDITTVHV